MTGRSFEKRHGSREVSRERTVFVPEGQNFKLLVASRLVVVKGTDQGRELTVKKERITIGRSSSCDLVLTDRAISGHHAELVTEENGRLVRDLNSKNGIFLMGHRVKEFFLRPGTQFRVGNDLLRFEPLDMHLKIPLSVSDHFGKALGRSVSMREIFALLEKVSLSTLPVLLLGETGTGKELVASAIHTHSKRDKHPFIILDCGAVPPKIIESILFGHEKGAFTGADRTSRGVFEEADGGTLFLDEVGELLPELQPKLLRVLEQHEVQRLGGVRTIPFDVRIVAATNRDLKTMIENNLFRDDLLYRLSGIEVRIPPLREHPEDVRFLVERFLDDANQQREKRGVPPVRFEEEALVLLESYSWPGNVRELRHLIERMLFLTDRETIGRRELQEQMGLAGGSAQSLLAVHFQDTYKGAKTKVLQQFDRQYLLNLLRIHHGNLSQATKHAGLVRHHLRKLCHLCDVPCGVEVPQAED